MQNLKRASYCSKMVFRHSYHGTCTYSFDKEEQIQEPQVDIKETKPDGRRLSNASLSSHDSGVGFSKADYEIQRAIRAQRVQRPHIIVLHKGKPIATTNNFNNQDEFETNIVVAAATASKRNRREISVIQKRQTITSTGKHFSLLKNNSAPNLYQATMKSQKIGQDKDVKNKALSIPKNKLLRSVSFSIKKFIGVNKEKTRQSKLIQQIF